MIAAYVTRYHSELIGDRRALTGILAVIVLMLAANKILAGFLLLNPFVALLPAMMAGAILALARSQRFALAIGVAVAILLLLQIRGSVEQFLVMLAGMAAVIFQLGDVRTRTTLIRATGVAATISFLAVIVTGMATAKPWPFALADAFWAGGCGLMTGFVVQGTLPLIESVFHVATSLTLLEWCDASRPLLKRLAMEAPGTYNHSLQLGSLCESAADAIGAGACSHASGRTTTTSARSTSPSTSSRTRPARSPSTPSSRPAMSLLIIIGHVKDGLELAREYGLPKSSTSSSSAITARRSCSTSTTPPPSSGKSPPTAPPTRRSSATRAPSPPPRSPRSSCSPTRPRAPSAP